MCLGECFWMKSAFESVDCPFQCLPEMGSQSSPALRLGLIPWTPLVLRPLDLDWNFTTNCPRSRLQMTDYGTPQPP